MTGGRGCRWWCWLLLLALPGAAMAMLRIDRAQFHVAGGPTITVALPDTWAQRGERPGRIGHYSASFTLDAVPQEGWAMRVDRLGTFHQVRLNGALVHDTLRDGPGLRKPVPTMLTLPPALLRAGENRIDISVDAGPRAGLSPLLLGAENELESGFLWSHHRAVTLPQMLNVASAGTALFMLLLWGLRPNETTIGTFGALALLTSLRNHAYFVVATPLPAALADWLYFVAQTLSVVLLGAFAMSFAGRRHRAYRAALLTTAVVLPLLGAVAAALGELHLARRWCYPWLLVLALPAPWLVLQVAQQRRSATEVTLVGGLVIVLLAATHDYLYQQGRTSVMDTYWLPYSVPAVMAIFSALLLRRLVAALESVEKQNTTLERRVAERTRDLQAANSATTRFLAAASHDLRQPMVSIGLLVGLLKEQVQGAPLQRIVQRLQEATGAMEGLLKRLLDLSRLQSGAVRVHRQPLALQPLFDAIVAHHADQALRKGLKLVVRPTVAVVDSDAALLEQILRNLVGNAVRYTERGGVLVGARAAGAGRVRIEVWDSGPGIPPEQREAIFGEFVRGDAPARDADARSGLGLGLAIVQRSAALLDVVVTLRSRLGRGSCFSVALPRAPAAAIAPATAVSPRGAPSPLAGRKLWLLEDNAGARASLELLLEHWGIDVQTCATLAAFDERLGAADAPPDLLITDQRLTDGHGGDALQRLHARWPLAKALIITGDTAPQDLAALERWRAAGVPVLLKPFQADALRAAALQALAPAGR